LRLSWKQKAREGPWVRILPFPNFFLPSLISINKNR